MACISFVFSRQKIKCYTIAYENYWSVHKRYGINVAPVGTVREPPRLNVHAAMIHLVCSQQLCTTQFKTHAVISTCRSTPLTHY